MDPHIEKIDIQANNLLYNSIFDESASHRKAKGAFLAHPGFSQKGDLEGCLQPLENYKLRFWVGSSVLEERLVHNDSKIATI